MYGNYIEVNGLLEDNEDILEGLKTLMKDRVGRRMKADGSDTIDFRGEYVVKQAWKTKHSFGDIKRNDDDIPCFTVGYKTTKIEDMKV